MKNLLHRPQWYWLAPAMALIGIWIRWLGVRIPVEHFPEARNAFEFSYDRVMLYFWLAQALGLLLLFVFGRRREAMLAWLLYFLIFVLGFVILQPVFYV